MMITFGRRYLLGRSSINSIARTFSTDNNNYNDKVRSDASRGRGAKAMVIDAIKHEFQNEKAISLGKAGDKTEQAIAKIHSLGDQIIKAKEKKSSALQLIVQYNQAWRLANMQRQNLVIQREAMSGMGSKASVLRDSVIKESMGSRVGESQTDIINKMFPLPKMLDENGQAVKNMKDAYVGTRAVSTKKPVQSGMGSQAVSVARDSVIKRSMSSSPTDIIEARRPSKMIQLSADLRQFSADIGYEFEDPGLLITALTHSSISSATRSNNERLEFLGDRVLGLVIAEALLDADAKASEGQLSLRLSALVRKETCADVALSVGIGDMLIAAKHQSINESLLGDAMEALIAAVYRDGGFTAARSLILRLWNTRITSVKADARDPKTILQEWEQARIGKPPTYVELSRTGPVHAPLFEIEVQLHSGEVARAKAGSKRQAELAAAHNMLERLGVRV